MGGQRRARSQRSTISPAAVTDAEGRFQIDDVPQVPLRPPYQSSAARTRWLAYASIDKTEIEELNARGRRPNGRNPMARVPNSRTGRPQPNILGDGFTASLQEGKRIRGQLTFADTGKPASPVRVQADLVQTTRADSQGMYSFEELEPRNYQIFARAPEDSDYLGQGGPVSIGRGRAQQRHDFALRKGAVISGQLRELEKAAPVRLHKVQVDFVEVSPSDQRTYHVLGSLEPKPDGSFGFQLRLKWPANQEVVQALSRAIPLAGDSRTTFHGVSCPRGLMSTRTLFWIAAERSMASFLTWTASPFRAEFLEIGEQAPSRGDGTQTFGFATRSQAAVSGSEPKRRLGAKITSTLRAPPPPAGRTCCLYNPLRRVVDEDAKPVPHALVAFSGAPTLIKVM